MSKKTLKAFIAFLEADAETSACRKVIVNQAVKTSEGTADIKLVPPLSDEEMLARLELGRLSKPN